jgi:hypothetical protein
LGHLTEKNQTMDAKGYSCATELPEKDRVSIVWPWSVDFISSDVVLWICSEVTEKFV